MNLYENDRMEQVDAAVVGGGLAGLTAATTLARAGLDVVLLEKGRRAGGRAVTREQEQFHFNLGAHALYISGEAYQILRELDVPFTGDTPDQGNLRFIVHDEQLTMPRLLLTSRLLSLSEKAKLALTFVRIMRTPPASAAHQTVQEWLDDHCKATAVRQAILSLLRVTSYTNAPKLLSADVLMRQFQLALRDNVLYLDGGWQTLVDGLRTAAETAGARIRTAARVTAVDDGGPRPRILLAEGRTLSAGAVILAVGPEAAAEQLPQNQAVRRWAATAVPVKVAALDVGLRRLPRPQVTYAQGIDRPLYYSVHSAAAQLAPAGGALIHTLKYLPPGAGNAEADEAELEAMLDRLQPGWRDEVVVRRFLPQMTVIRRMATAEEGLGGRPGPQIPGSDGVYVAGDWVGSAGWLADAAMASAREAARLVLRQPRPSLESEPVHAV